MPSNPDKKWFIMYDVSSEKRRNKIATLLADFGFRLQKSVFQCRLSQKQFDTVRSRLSSLIDRKDSVIAVPVCEADMKQIHWLGQKNWSLSDKFFYL